MSRSSIVWFAVNGLVVFSVLFWLERKREWYIRLMIAVMFMVLTLAVVVLVRLR